MSVGDQTWLLLGLALYLVIVLSVGLITWRRLRSLDDFVLGGRRLNPIPAALSERASGESAWFLLGLPGAAYALGFREFWSVIGIAFGIFCSWTLLARLLNAECRRLGALTLPDYFESRFDDKTRTLRLTSMLIILLFYTAYVGAQFVGAGKILLATFGPSMESVAASISILGWSPTAQQFGMMLGAIVVVFYTFMGGFLAVVWTDVVQGLLMMLVAVALPVLGVWKLGGPVGFLSTLEAKGPELLTMSGGETGHAFLFGVVIGGVSWGLGYFGQPHLLTRYMAIRRPEEVRTGQTVAMSWVLLAYWGAVFVGLVGIGLVDAGLLPAFDDPEQVMPRLAIALLPAWLAGLAVAGAIAAMMSTADSQLVVATSAVIEDIYARLLKPATSPRRLLLYSRLATVGIAAVALFLAFRNERLIFDWVAYAWAGLGSSFGPVLILSLRWRRTTKAGALAGMLGGMVSTIVWQNVAALNAALDLKVASFVIALVLAVGVSLATSRPHTATR
jgi:sodium/proline symporter